MKDTRTLRKEIREIEKQINDLDDQIRDLLRRKIEVKKQLSKAMDEKYGGEL